MKLCTHLGDFGKSPYSGISDAGYIQNFNFLQQNKNKEDEGERKEYGKIFIAEPPEAAKQVSASALHWGRTLPPGTTQAGKHQLLIRQAGRLAGVEAAVVCSTVLFRQGQRLSGDCYEREYMIRIQVSRGKLYPSYSPCINTSHSCSQPAFCLHAFNIDQLSWKAGRTTSPQVTPSRPSSNLF